MWVGPARVETVFDTGSTRNSFDQEFLKQLLMEKSTQWMSRMLWTLNLWSAPA